MDKQVFQNLKRQSQLASVLREWKERDFLPNPDVRDMLEELEKISHYFGMQEGLLVGCFDYRDLSLPFFSKNVEQVTGYSAEFLQDHGMKGVLAAIHPEDAQKHMEFNAMIIEVFHSLTLKERQSFEISYTLRWLHKDTKEEIWFFSRAKPYLIDSNGNLVLDLHFSMQVPNHGHLNGHDWSYSYTKEDGSKVLQQKHHKEKIQIRLSKKEKEVASLLLQGLDSQAIGEKLFISKNTVYVHRKNIIKKLKAKNTAEMMKILISNNVE